MPPTFKKKIRPINICKWGMDATECSCIGAPLTCISNYFVIFGPNIYFPNVFTYLQNIYYVYQIFLLFIQNWEAPFYGVNIGSKSGSLLTITFIKWLEPIGINSTRFSVPWDKCPKKTQTSNIFEQL